MEHSKQDEIIQHLAETLLFKKTLEQYYPYPLYACMDADKEHPLNDLCGAILGGMTIKEVAYLTVIDMETMEDIPDPNMYQAGNVILCHPETARRIRKSVLKKA